MSRKVADVLWAMLTNAGVKRCYGIVGDALNPVIDALSRNGKIERFSPPYGKPLRFRPRIVLLDANLLEDIRNTQRSRESSCGLTISIGRLWMVYSKRWEPK